MMRGNVRDKKHDRVGRDPQSERKEGVVERRDKGGGENLAVVVRRRRRSM